MLWIATVGLVVVFLMAGVMKLTRSNEALRANPRTGCWTEDFDLTLIRTIGGLEVLEALGLVLPAITSIAIILVPLAATGLAITMAGAALTHGRRRETPQWSRTWCCSPCCCSSRGVASARTTSAPDRRDGRPRLSAHHGSCQLSAG